MTAELKALIEDSVAAGDLLIEARGEANREQALASAFEIRPTTAAAAMLQAVAWHDEAGDALAKRRCAPAQAGRGATGWTHTHSSRTLTECGGEATPPPHWSAPQLSAGHSEGRTTMANFISSEHRSEHHATCGTCPWTHLYAALADAKRGARRHAEPRARREARAARAAGGQVCASDPVGIVKRLATGTRHR